MQFELFYTYSYVCYVNDLLKDIVRGVRETLTKIDMEQGAFKSSLTTIKLIIAFGSRVEFENDGFNS